MTWTSTADVVDRWVGGDPPAHSPLLRQLIADAEEILLSEFPDLQSRIDTGSLSTRRVVIVVVRMVHRVLRNPAGVRQETETVGPFSQNRTFAGQEPGQPTLMAADRKILGYDVTRPNAFTVPMANEPVSWFNW